MSKRCPYPLVSRHRARPLAVLEAIAGNLYLALLVARLVGLYRSELGESKGERTRG